MKPEHNSIKAGLVAVIVILLVFLSIPANAAKYTYDSLHRLISVSYDSGQKESFSCDSGGNITSVTHSVGTVISAVYTSPADKAAGVAVDSKISVTFSVYVQPGSAFETISVTDAVYNPVEITKDISGPTLTIDPVNDLGYGTCYTVKIPAYSVIDSVYNGEFKSDCDRGRFCPSHSGF